MNVDMLMVAVTNKNVGLLKKLIASNKYTPEVLEEALDIARTHPNNTDVIAELCVKHVGRMDTYVSIEGLEDVLSEIRRQQINILRAIADRKPEVLREKLKQGKFTIKDLEESGIYIYAALTGSKDLLKALIDYTDITEKKIEKIPAMAIDAAVLSGNTDAVKYLLNHGDTRVEGISAETLQTATLHPPVLRVLLEWKDKAGHGFTVNDLVNARILELLISRNDIDSVKYILNKFVDYNKNKITVGDLLANEAGVLRALKALNNMEIHGLFRSFRDERDRVLEAYDYSQALAYGVYTPLTPNPPSFIEAVKMARKETVVTAKDAIVKIIGSVIKPDLVPAIKEVIKSIIYPHKKAKLDTVPQLRKNKLKPAAQGPKPDGSRPWEKPVEKQSVLQVSKTQALPELRKQAFPQPPLPKPPQLLKQPLPKSLPEPPKQPLPEPPKQPLPEPPKQPLPEPPKQPLPEPPKPQKSIDNEELSTIIKKTVKETLEMEKAEDVDLNDVKKLLKKVGPVRVAEVITGNPDSIKAVLRALMPTSKTFDTDVDKAVTDLRANYSRKDIELLAKHMDIEDAEDVYIEIAKKLIYIHGEELLKQNRAKCENYKRNINIEKIRKKIYGEFKKYKNSVSKMTTDDLLRLFKRYDELCFDGDIMKHMQDVDYKLKFKTSGEYTFTTEGICTFKTCDYTITIPLEIFNRVNGVTNVAGHDCKDQLECLLRVIEHELTHVIVFIFCGDPFITDQHGPLFMNLVKDLFKHTDHRHYIF